MFPVSNSWCAPGEEIQAENEDAREPGWSSHGARQRRKRGSETRRPSALRIAVTGGSGDAREEKNKQPSPTVGDNVRWDTRPDNRRCCSAAALRRWMTLSLGLEVFAVRGGWQPVLGCRRLWLWLGYGRGRRDMGLH